MNNKKINLGEVCVHCRDSVKFGSGKFVDRYPVFGLEDDEEGIEYDGYCCADCEASWYAECDEFNN